MAEVAKEAYLDASAQIVLNELELAGTIISVLVKVRTGGTCDRFYKPAVGARIKVFGPKKQS